MDIIRWNWRLRTVDPEGLSLHFEQGVEKGFDFVVGADGAWSKVRPLLTEVRPYYAGVGAVDLSIGDAEPTFPNQYKPANRGSILILER